MKTLLRRRGTWLPAFVTLACSSVHAGTFSANFDDGAVPNGTSVYDTTVVETTGGFAGGALKLVKNSNSLQGGFVIEDLDGGAEVNSVNATFKARVGGGTIPPADGWSFCVANDLPTTGWSEEGIGTGLIVAFDIYDNGAAEAPAVTIRWNNIQIAEVKPGLDAMTTGENSTPQWADVQIKLDNDGSLDVIFDGVTLISNLYTPFEPILGSKYGFGARTGGLNTNVFIDNLNITTTTGGIVPALVHQPQNSIILSGQPIQFYTLVANETNVLGYQWERQAPGGGAFTAINGANSRDYIGPNATAADNGAKYRLALQGIDTTVHSDEVALTVGTLPEPVYTYTQNFDGGSIPAAQGAIYGTTVLDSGILRLTDAAEGQGGGLVINDLNAGGAVGSIFVSFDLLMSDSITDVPADGFSFNWGPNMPAGTVGGAEDGAGDGLRICFDVYDNTDANPANGIGEGPSLDVRWGTTLLSTVRVTPEEFNTNSGFVKTLVSLDAAGRVSVAFNGRQYFKDVQVPNWTALSNAQFGFYARTGGANQKHEIDNLRIRTDAYIGAVQITDDADDTLAGSGTTATFSIALNYAIPPATVQWQRKAAGAADFSNIAGANALAYTTPVLAPADTGALYRALVGRTSTADSVTSREALLTVINFNAPANADVVLNFDNSDLANTGSAASAVIATYGTTVSFSPSGGVGDSGYLSLSEPATDQNGFLVVENFSGASAQGALLATFDVNLTASGTNVQGTPADGFSLSWGADVPAAAFGGAEAGAGTGLIFTFDTYINADLGETSRSVKIKSGGTVIANLNVPLSFYQPLDWAKAAIRVTNEGKASVMFNSQVIFHDVQIPNWTGLANGRFNLGARTGGAFETHWFDNFVLNTDAYVGPISITQQPASTGVLTGFTATFTAQINDPAQTSWQWQSAPAGSNTFTNINGATANSYTTPVTALADNGRQYRVVATGQSSNATSNIAVLTVVDATLPAPTAMLNFDNQTSLNYLLSGHAYEDPASGVNGSTAAILTDNMSHGTGQSGMLFIEDFNGGDPVNSMIASFSLRVGGNTGGVPADGVAFVWGNDVNSASSFGEEGAGNGLIVSFDTYTNGAADPIGISLKYEGQVLAEKPMPTASLLSDPDYYPVVVKLDSDGTVDVWYNNLVIFHNVVVPGWTSLSGANWVWGARTGGEDENAFIDNINLYTTTASTGPAGSIAIQAAGGNLVITYTGTLQSSTNLTTGSWQNVGGASAPTYTIPMPTAGTLFFRAVGQ